MRLLILLLLAGCASEKVVYKPVEISMPVAVECKIEALPIPIWPTASLDERTGLFDAVKAFIAEIELRKGYEAQLEGAVKSCQ
jgi:hypothetical protein